MRDIIDDLSNQGQGLGTREMAVEIKRSSSFTSIREGYHTLQTPCFLKSHEFLNLIVHTPGCQG